VSHEPYVDEKELAQRTGVSRRTWQKYRVMGVGPPYRKLERRVLYLWSEVRAWIDAQIVTPKQP
jgi:predicted DNA-binding transcriptional regulator AlpA